MMKRLVVAVMLFAVGCAPSAVSLADPSSAADATSSPTASVQTSPTPKPTPAPRAIAEAYLVIAGTYNRSRDILMKLPFRNWRLANYKSWCGDFKRITDVFAKQLAVLTLTDAAMEKARAALAKETNLESAAFRRCAGAKTFTAIVRYAKAVDALTPKGLALSQAFRETLGLPTTRTYH